LLRGRNTFDGRNSGGSERSSDQRVGVGVGVDFIMDGFNQLDFLFVLLLFVIRMASSLMAEQVARLSKRVGAACRVAYKGTLAGVDAEMYLETKRPGESLATTCALMMVRDELGLFLRRHVRVALRLPRCRLVILRCRGRVRTTTPLVVTTTVICSAFGLTVKSRSHALARGRTA
jgi:hypothetical protein